MEKKYIKDGEKIYEVNKEIDKISELKEIDKKITKLNELEAMRIKEIHDSYVTKIELLQSRKTELINTRETPL